MIRWAVYVRWRHTRKIERIVTEDWAYLHHLPCWVLAVLPVPEVRVSDAVN